MGGSPMENETLTFVRKESRLLSTTLAILLLCGVSTCSHLPQGWYAEEFGIAIKKEAEPLGVPQF